MRHPRAAVFIGNSIFGDDQVGLLIGQALQSRLEALGFDVYVLERTGFALLDCLEGYEGAAIVDSFCAPGRPEGEVRHFSVDDFRTVKSAAPHYSGVPEAVGLMRELGMKVADVSVIGINVRDPYTLRDRPSDSLSLLIDELSEKVFGSICILLEARARG